MLCYLLSTILVLMGNSNPIGTEILPIEEIKNEDSDAILGKVGLGRKSALVPPDLEIVPTNLEEKMDSDGSLFDIRFAELEDKFDKEDESKRDDLAGQLILNTLNTFEQMGIDLEDVD